MTTDAPARVARVVAGAIAQAVRDARAASIMIAAPDTPEGRWLAEICASAGIPADPAPAPPLALRDALGHDEAGREVAERAAAEVVAIRRSAVIAHPANRTALLLGGVPPAPLLPLGDVPAAVIAAARGGWSAPDPVRRLADAAGGIDVLDRHVHGWLDRRESFERAMHGLPEDVIAEIRSRFQAGRFGRRRAGLVVKVGQRTIGHDLQI